MGFVFILISLFRLFVRILKLTFTVFRPQVDSDSHFEFEDIETEFFKLIDSTYVIWLKLKGFFFAFLL